MQYLYKFSLVVAFFALTGKDDPEPKATLTAIQAQNVNSTGVRTVWYWAAIRIP